MDQNIFPMALQAWLANLGASFKRGASTPRTLDHVAEAVCFEKSAFFLVRTTY